MRNRDEIKIGTKVTFDGYGYHKIIEIKEEKVETMKKGVLTFYKLFFEDHPPRYRHSVIDWKNDE